jgi:hypothetical protein
VWALCGQIDCRAQTRLAARIEQRLMSPMQEQKISVAELREMGLSGVVVWCHCGHHVAVSADTWPDELRLSEIEERCVCSVPG